MGKNAQVGQTDHPGDIVLTAHQPVAQQNKHHRADTKVHQVFHNNIAGVLGSGKAGLYHSKAALHKENQHCADQKPHAEQLAVHRFHDCFKPHKVLLFITKSLKMEIKKERSKTDVRALHCAKECRHRANGPAPANDRPCQKTVPTVREGKINTVPCTCRSPTERPWCGTRPIHSPCLQYSY